MKKLRPGLLFDVQQRILQVNKNNSNNYFDEDTNIGKIKVFPRQQGHSLNCRAEYDQELFVSYSISSNFH